MALHQSMLDQSWGIAQHGRGGSSNPVLGAVSKALPPCGQSSRQGGSTLGRLVWSRSRSWPRRLERFGGWSDNVKGGNGKDGKKGKGKGVKTGQGPGWERKANEWKDNKEKPDDKWARFLWKHPWWNLNSERLDGISFDGILQMCTSMDKGGCVLAASMVSGQCWSGFKSAWQFKSSSYLV